MKDRAFLIVALAVSVAANLYLAALLRQRTASSQGEPALQQMEHAMAQLREVQRLNWPVGVTAGLAVRLGDCASCFDFLQLFVSFCRDQYDRCQILLVGGTAAQASELTLRYAVPVAVLPVAELPVELGSHTTPVVWVRKGGELVLVRRVPPEAPAQVQLALELQAAIW